MDMDVGQIASALNHKLVIEDIDESDRDNPQLCAEYVKAIYAYMRELEVSYQLWFAGVAGFLVQFTPSIYEKSEAKRFFLQ